MAAVGVCDELDSKYVKLFFCVNVKKMKNEEESNDLRGVQWSVTS